jgi:hypothetical protein
MTFTIDDLRLASGLACIESRAETAALSRNAGLTRLSEIPGIRKASGVRPVYRRFAPGLLTK